MAFKKGLSCEIRLAKLFKAFSFLQSCIWRPKSVAGSDFLVEQSMVGRLASVIGPTRVPPVKQMNLHYTTHIYVSQVYLCSQCCIKNHRDYVVKIKYFV